MFCILFNLQNVSWLPEPKFWHEWHRRDSFCLYHFVPSLLPWKFLVFSFLLPLIYLPFLFLMCRPVCYALCAPLVLCDCWRMQPSKVASLFLLLLESTPEACGCLPCAFDSFIMWLGCSFSHQSLADGHLGHFQSSAITNVAMNNNVHLSSHVFARMIPLGVDFYERDWWVKKQMHMQFW